MWTRRSSGSGFAAALTPWGFDSAATSGRFVIGPAEAFTTQPALGQLNDAIAAGLVSAPPRVAPLLKKLSRGAWRPALCELTVDPFPMVLPTSRLSLGKLRALRLAA